MDAVIIIGIVELVMKYGPALALKMIHGLSVDNPTIEQIRGLMVKPPEWYFKQLAEGGNDGS